MQNSTFGKDGDDVINTVTCALTGTESISEYRIRPKKKNRFVSANMLKSKRIGR